jgi:hypothetical protein
MTVQKKWQYLESIFIGSDDIKQQLPDAAKKFDVRFPSLPPASTRTHAHALFAQAAAEQW